MFSWGIDLSEIGQPSKKMKKKAKRSCNKIWNKISGNMALR